LTFSQRHINGGLLTLRVESALLHSLALVPPTGIELSPFHHAQLAYCPSWPMFVPRFVPRFDSRLPLKQETRHRAGCLRGGGYVQPGVSVLLACSRLRPLPGLSLGRSTGACRRPCRDWAAGSADCRRQDGGKAQEHPCGPMSGWGASQCPRDGPSGALRRLRGSQAG